MPHPSSIPKSMTRSFLVLQVPTDAWVQIFADRIVMGVSQLEGKIGTYLLCEAVTSPTNLRQTEFHLSTLLGNRTDDSSAMMGVYARTLMERLRKYHESNNNDNNNNNNNNYALDEGSDTRPTVLLLGISLDKEKGTDPKMFQSIIDILVDMYVDVTRDQS